jgi:putative ABC transport system substrate-binding protein
MNRRIIHKLSGLFLMLVVYLGSAYIAPAQQNRPLTIAIIQPYDISAYHKAVEGFIEQLRTQLKRDFTTIVYESKEGLEAALEQRRLNPEMSGIDLILTVGSKATTEVAQNITNIPIVFTMVLNPERTLQDAQNVVGVSLNIPVELQFRMIKQVLPTAKNVGVIYNPAQNASVVEESAKIAEQEGLRLKRFPVNSPKDIPDALEQVSEQADILWGIVDETVYTSRTTVSIIQTTWKKQLPFVGTSEPYVKAGALWALVFDNKDVGRQSARLASQILMGTSVKTLQGTSPQKIGWILNLRTAKLIGIEFPEHIINQAWEAYE